MFKYTFQSGYITGLHWLPVLMTRRKSLHHRSHRLEHIQLLCDICVVTVRVNQNSIFSVNTTEISLYCFCFNWFAHFSTNKFIERLCNFFFILTPYNVLCVTVGLLKAWFVSSMLQIWSQRSFIQSLLFCRQVKRWTGEKCQQVLQGFLCPVCLEFSSQSSIVLHTVHLSECLRLYWKLGIILENKL